MTRDVGVPVIPTEPSPPNLAIRPDVVAREAEARFFESVWCPEHTHLADVVLPVLDAPAEAVAALG